MSIRSRFIYFSAAMLLLTATGCAPEPTDDADVIISDEVSDGIAVPAVDPLAEPAAINDGDELDVVVEKVAE